MITLPISVFVGKKKFILNLNNYRNAHYRKLNDSKKAYKEMIWHLLPNDPISAPVELIYTYFHGNGRKLDVSNVCSIIDKYTCDALVEKGVLAEDNIDHVGKVTYIWGGVDKENPRCELIINEY